MPKEKIKVLAYRIYGLDKKNVRRIYIDFEIDKRLADIHLNYQRFLKNEVDLYRKALCQQVIGEGFKDEFTISKRMLDNYDVSEPKIKFIEY